MTRDNATSSGFDRERPLRGAAPPLRHGLLFHLQTLGEFDHAASGLDCVLQSYVTFRHDQNGKALQ